jgi:type I restriction enzyme S subunit
MADAWKEYELGELLSYEQPTPYIVESTDYNDKYKTPVLTAGKTFILGYTNEENGVYDKLPVIIFDDFTTASQYVNFRFKVKSSAMKILKADTSLVLPKFIYYRMQSIKFDHSTHKRYWIQHYSKIKVSVPSIPEQERIVARIEELFSQLDASVAELQTAKKRLKVYRQAVLKEAFLGKLTKNYRYDIDIDLEWSLENATKYLPRIPSEWRYIPLSKLGDLGRGKSKHRPRNDGILFENGKYPFIQTGDIKSANKANKYVTTYSKMYGDYGLQQSKLWPKGTLCITIAANIAETAFLGIDACFPDSVVGFTAYEHVLPTYIKYFIESEKIRLWAFAPATAQKNINLDTLENLIVPYCSLKEQQKVVDEIESRFSVCDSIEKTIDTALQQAEALRQSILKQAFEGKL